MKTDRQTVMRDDLVRLLAEIAQSDTFQEVLAPVSSRLEQLQSLESLGYIRYCPYPEEFWVVLPAGKEFLSSLGPAASYGAFNAEAD